MLATWRYRVALLVPRRAASSRTVRASRPAGVGEADRLVDDPLDGEPAGAGPAAVQTGGVRLPPGPAARFDLIELRPGHAPIVGAGLGRGHPFGVATGAARRPTMAGAMGTVLAPSLPGLQSGLPLAAAFGVGPDRRASTHPPVDPVDPVHPGARR